MKYFLITLLLLMSVYTKADIDIITNEAVGQPVMSDLEVYDIFVFRNLMWNNGNDIRVVVMPLHSSIHRAFLQRYVGMGYLGYKRKFNNRVNTARDRAPIEVDTEAEMLEELSRRVEAVGYVETAIRDVLADYGIEVVEIQ